MMGSKEVEPSITFETRAITSAQNVANRSERGCIRDRTWNRAGLLPLIFHLFRRRKRTAHLLVLLMIVLPMPVSFGQEIFTPESPLRGRFVFEQKGCINCHALQGDGARVGPDLGQKKFYGTFLQLASVMWNHSPEMVRRMKELDLPYPEFSRREMRELIAFLYYVRYLGEPGDLYRGKMLVREKGCLTCHSIAGKGGNYGPAFDQLAKYVSPVYMAQAMWNHGPGMNREIKKRGLQRPVFAKGEIGDLSAYIRSAANKGGEQERLLMSPGNPKRGRKMVESKGCLDCHALYGKGGKLGPDFTKLEWDYSVTEIAGRMWNHAAVMAELIPDHTAWPRFAGREMADLISYLYFLGFQDKPGDPESGRHLIAVKGCVQCHGKAGEGSENAPSLITAEVLASPEDMARIMWNHAPAMEGKVTEKAIDWPTLSGKDMADILAFLQTQSK